MAGKGSKRRPTLVSREEEDLRWELAYGRITRRTFDEKMVELKEKKNVQNEQLP